MKIKVIVW